MSRPLYKSLTGKLIGLLLVGAAAGIILFFIMYLALLNGIDYCLLNSTYYEGEEQRSVQNLQNYIDRNDIVLEDSTRLTQWVKKQDIVFLLVYKDDFLVYDSTYEQEDAYSESRFSRDAWMTPYTVQFADGDAEVYLYGMYEYKFYMYALMASIGAGVFLFFLIFILGVKREVNYIQKLEEDVHLMEGGCMEKPVVIRGNDELSMLADGIEHMRLSFQENMKMEEKLTQANRNLITGMSHDLRTPLTALFVYLQILQSSDETDLQNKKHYVDKAMEKAGQIKALSDQMFEFFLVSREDQVPLEAPQMFRSAFMDCLSEMVMFLESQEYAVECALEWRPVEVEVRTDYIGRIMDNITSNLLKYASCEEKIRIHTIYEEDFAGIEVENMIADQEEEVESTKVGTVNIRLMMEKMNGTCEIGKKNGTYRIAVKFPVYEIKRHKNNS